MSLATLNASYYFLSNDLSCCSPATPVGVSSWFQTNNMGIGFVLLIWAAVGIVLSGAGALIFGLSAAYLTRGALNGRKRLILTASLFPLACLGWAGAVFIFQAVINETVLHRDAGLGDTWECPLPNGYSLLMIDTTNQGWVYNPKTQSGGGVGEQEDAVGGVRIVQVSGQYVLGGSDSRPIAQSVKNPEQVDSYFLLDTQVGKHTKFPSYDALRANAQQLGIALNLQPIADVYGKYRFTWFEVFAGLLTCLPPLVGAVLLVRWVIRVRRTRRISLRPA